MPLQKNESPVANLLGSAADIGAAAALPEIKLKAVGDSASAGALEKLSRALKGLQQQEIPRMLREAINHIRAGDNAAAEKMALAALKLDESQGIAWHILAIAREKQGDFGGSLRCYDAALKLLPDETTIALDLGRLASRMDMPDFAMKLYAIHLEKNPDNLEAINNFATALREMARFEEAIDVIKPALTRNPDSAMLWNTLGTILGNQGDAATACVFFDEAIRLKPQFALSWYNRSNSRFDTGDLEGALTDGDMAISLASAPGDIDTMKFSRAIMLIGGGELREGWEAYEARFLPGHGDAPKFVANARRWTPDDDLAGKKLFIFNEQGIGDEVLFASLYPDVIEAVGPDGQITIGVEQRLKSLFQRSFPSAHVVAHKTVKLEGRVTRGTLEFEDWSEIDIWTPSGSLLRQFRNSVESFPKTTTYLKPDPERVAHWKAWLNTLPEGPKIGLLWKSLKVHGERARGYSPFRNWEPILAQPGAVFVNLQYGDCATEIELAKSEFGIEIFQPPGIDLKADLDDLAALCQAMDLVMGSANATTQIAGAVGAPLWIITGQLSWTRLGSEHYPWHSSARIFTARSYIDWTPLMTEMADALGEFIKQAAPLKEPGLLAAG